MDHTIIYIAGNAETLDRIRHLWEGLNRHHAAVSPHFKADFLTFTFEQRKSKLLEKYRAGKMRLDIAQAADRAVGYVISAVMPDGVGEIESIFIQDGYRGQGIGDVLMRRALAWLDENSVHTKQVAVAVGNEGAYPFYARFGFYPRVTLLKY